VSSKITSDMMKRLFMSIALAAGLAPGALFAQQTFDNSGNSLLHGTYFIRQVWYGNLSSTGVVGEAASLTGTITFNAGTYTVNAQVADTAVSGGAPQALNTTGNYAANSSGMFAMDDPLSPGDVLYGGIGASAIVGSATESLSFDFMVAVPMGSSVSSSSLKGSYRMVGMDYPNGDVTKVSNYTFLINPDGAGNLPVASLTGHAVNVNNTLYTQSITGATYSLTATTGTMTFPAQASGTSLISGTKQFFLSSDGNILVGGALNGYDIQIGIAVGSSSPAAGFNGTYFNGGQDYDASSFAANGYYYLDSFTGSAHVSTTASAASAVTDLRLDADNWGSYDYTYLEQFAIASDGSGPETGYLNFVGVGGNAKVVIGQSTNYSVELDVLAQPLTVTGPVILNPLGIVNGANYLPITNPVAPGEFVSLFGTGIGPSTAVVGSLPYQTTLGGVSVTVNGIPAPVQLASSGQVNCIVPYGVNTFFAVFQLTYNSQKSNSVTVYVDSSSPGSFSLNNTGTGPASALHLDGTLVNAASPAKIGETIELFVTGLGAVTPSSPDGAPASSTVLSWTNDTIDIYVDGVLTTPLFTGLAPYFAGLYQVNLTIPSVPDTGLVNLDIADENNGAYSSVASINVAAASSGKIQVAPHRRGPSLGRVATAKETAAHRRFANLNTVTTAR